MTSSNTAVAEPPTKLPAAQKRKHLQLLAIIVGVIVAFVVFLFWLYERAYESTDDASIEGHVISISPKVSGYVSEVLVEDNARVIADQPLVRLDPTDYQAERAELAAEVETARTQIEQARKKLAVLRAARAQSDSELHVAEANEEFARADLQRISRMANAAISKQDRERSSAAEKVAVAQTAAQKSKIIAADAEVADGENEITVAQSQLVASEARLKQRELKVYYTTITSPISGRVTRKTAEPGAYVAPGQLLLSIVPDSLWIVANFKETQLEHMEIGQAVSIYVDAYPALDFRGHVDSFQSGTGSRFSVLPAENATGNYVKVVQRVPVKIVFDPLPDKKIFLAPGMSVVPTVKIR